MNADKLGDSYDAVKRLWRDLLAASAPLFADTQFIPTAIEATYTKLTGIPMLSPTAPRKFSIFNDPDTGIRLPQATNQAEGQTHITLATIMQQLRRQSPRCVVTFDQSHYRNSGLSIREQRSRKLAHLDRNGMCGFYYDSHAWFLFACRTKTELAGVKRTLLKAGIPDDRLMET